MSTIRSGAALARGRCRRQRGSGSAWNRRCRRSKSGLRRVTASRTEAAQGLEGSRDPGCAVGGAGRAHRAAGDGLHDDQSTPFRIWRTRLTDSSDA